MQKADSPILTLMLALAVLGVSSPCGAGVEPSFDWLAETAVVWPMYRDAPQQHAAVTLSDWYRVGAMSRRPGTRFILNSLALSGVRTVWWRVMDGGQCKYPTQVPGATVARLADVGYDCQAFDHLAEAVSFGHQLGLKVYAWMPLLEEAHAWPACARSHYVDAHRELWDRTIDGHPSGAPSFYHEAYRAYKLKIADELMMRYAIDGLVLDFERTGAPHHSSKTGYLPQIVAAYRRATGIDAYRVSVDDPDWVAFRAGYIGRFIEQLRDRVRQLDRPVELVMMYRANRPLAVWCDAQRWAEEGYFDSAALVDYGPEGWGTATDQAVRWRDQAEGLGIPAGMVLYASGSRVPNETFAHRARAAMASGFDPLVYFESTHLFWNERFNVSLAIAAPRRAELISPSLDLTGGGVVRVQAAGPWQLHLASVDGERIAAGEAGRVVEVRLPAGTGAQRLVMVCSLAENAQHSGVAVEGWAMDAAGKRQPIRTDATWESLNEQAPLRVVGHPGVPPFLVPYSDLAEGER